MLGLLKDSETNRPLRHRKHAVVLVETQEENDDDLPSPSFFTKRLYVLELTRPGGRHQRNSNENPTTGSELSSSLSPARAGGMAICPNG